MSRTLTVGSSFLIFSLFGSQQVGVSGSGKAAGGTRVTDVDINQGNNRVLLDDKISALLMLYARSGQEFSMHFF